MFPAGIFRVLAGVKYQQMPRPRLRTFYQLLISTALTNFAFAVPSLLAAAQNDETAHLEIRFDSGITTFHIGEVIPLQLDFSASGPNLYQISTRNYDRSGRLNLEQFHVSPPARDPLRTYFEEGMFLGGGLGSSKLLNLEPESIREELNEWLALDTPGQYTLTVTSFRVSRQGNTQIEPMELHSNTLEFNIIAADPAWQAAQLQFAVAILNDKATTPPQKTSALRSLRFLDTSASVHELVGQFGQNSETGCWDCVAGLAGSLHRKLVIHELEQHFAAPDFAITQDYLFILAKLKFQLEHEPLPPYPQQDPRQQETWQRKVQARNGQLDQLQDSLYQQATSLATQKQNGARAQTIRTLLLRPYGPKPHPPLLLPPQKIAESFGTLPAEEQYTLLSVFAERFKLAAMVAPLQALTEQPVLHHPLLRDLALRCLYDLDPVAGRRGILEEITHPHVEPVGGFTVTANTLGILPDKTLPRFDDFLATRMENNNSGTLPLDAQLIGRYATAAILPRVRAVYSVRAGQWDCETEDGFVLYLLRIQPDFGMQRLAAAPVICMTNSLPFARRIHRWSEVEPAIIEAVNNPDLNRARQAAETLARYGSDPNAKAALWARVRRFHDQWAGRDAELVDHAGMPRSATDAMSFEYGLVHAIGTARAWILSSAEVTILEKLTVGSETESVKEWYPKSPIDIHISAWPNGHIQGSIQQYNFQDLTSLREKLNQYPTSTHFAINLSANNTQFREALAAIHEISAAHGLIIKTRHSPGPL